MEKHPVTRILQEIAEQGVPANMDLWPAIRTRLQSQRRIPRRARWMPATRLGWAGLILGTLLLLGSVAYALPPVIGQVFRMLPGWQHVEERHLAQELNLSQTLDGVTVTLERVYADANEIIIGYTVKGLADQKIHLSQARLSDKQGTVFPELAGAGVTGASELLGLQLPPGEGAYVTAFDASAVKGTPSSLHLQLTMHLAKLVPVDQASTPPSEPSASTTVATVMTMREEKVGGPFIFDFSVPFIPGQTVEVQQEVETAGITMKLERVVITPSETRAILCFEPPDDIEWTLLADLDAGDGQEVPTSFVSRLNGSGGEDCHRISYLDSLTGRAGLWTLTVTELVGTDLSKQPSEDVRLAGPWVFRFHVP